MSDHSTPSQPNQPSADAKKGSSIWSGFWSKPTPEEAQPAEAGSDHSLASLMETVGELKRQTTAQQQPAQQTTAQQTTAPEAVTDASAARDFSQRFIQHLETTESLVGTVEQFANSWVQRGQLLVTMSKSINIEKQQLEQQIEQQNVEQKQWLNEFHRRETELGEQMQLVTQAWLEVEDARRQALQAARQASAISPMPTHQPTAGDNQYVDPAAFAGAGSDHLTSTGHPAQPGTTLPAASQSYNNQPYNIQPGYPGTGANNQPGQLNQPGHPIAPVAPHQHPAAAASPNPQPPSTSPLQQPYSQDGYPAGADRQAGAHMPAPPPVQTNAPLPPASPQSWNSPQPPSMPQPPAASYPMTPGVPNPYGNQSPTGHNEPLPPSPADQSSSQYSNYPYPGATPTSPQYPHRSDGSSTNASGE